MKWYYDWIFNSQKGFLKEALIFLRKPQQEQKLHISTIWTVQLQTHFPLEGSQVTERQTPSDLASLQMQIHMLTWDAI